jgi:hypothetical protein
MELKRRYVFHPALLLAAALVLAGTTLTATARRPINEN